jgi:hypothetical protein
MVSKTTPTIANLAALGAERLAEILLEISEGDATAKRRLRLELAAKAAPKTVAKAVRKRLAEIDRAGGFVDRHAMRRFAADLEAQRRAIVDRVAKIDAAQALDLMWRFIDLADGVNERVDDSNGVLSDIFRTACRDLGALAQAAKPDAIDLADRAFAALNDNGYGQYDGLIETLAPVLGAKGLDHLKARFVALSSTPVEKPRASARRAIGWSMNGPIYEDEIRASSLKHAVRHALQAIADAQGDVDAFIGQYDQATRKVPGVAAEIAVRLLAAGRAGEALRVLEAAERRGTLPDWEWEDTRIAVLDALGRGDEAQAARWSCFERWLSPAHLRDCLKRLPDFDDIEAERKALALVERHASALGALEFLVLWPALDRAARLVIDRIGELDGNHYQILSPAADALAGKHPLAATLALRAMIDFALKNGRASRYSHAARHLMECASLAASIADYARFETHEAYAARLKAAHGRKTAFWAEVAA